MNRVTSSLVLIAAAVTAAILLSVTQDLAAPRITANELQERLKALQAVLPTDGFDNEPHIDRTFVTSPQLLGVDEPLPVYRARLDGEPVAVVLTAIAPNGFTGKIRLLIGIDVTGKVIAVRAIEHEETPGLGDRIDPDKSDWIDGFSGLQTDNPLADDWILDKDGGNFDHITGATISSHAVINAARNAVLYFGANQQALFDADAVE